MFYELKKNANNKLTNMALQENIHMYTVVFLCAVDLDNRIICDERVF